MVAIPTGILSAGFMEQVSIVREKAVVEGVIRDTAFAEQEQDGREEYSYCPYCGKRLH